MWTLYLLARNPDVQQQLHDEVCSVLKPGEHATPATLQKMPFLRGCVKETLRYTVSRLALLHQTGTLGVGVSLKTNHSPPLPSPFSIFENFCGKMVSPFEAPVSLFDSVTVIMLHKFSLTLQ